MVLGDVWLDFDPAAFVTTGLDVDDDLAFLVLLALQNRGHLNLVGVSVAAGHAALRDTLDNARRLLPRARPVRPWMASTATLARYNVSIARCAISPPSVLLVWCGPVA